MSANVKSMFSGMDIIPWHNEGTIVAGRLTAAEAIVTAGLDFHVGLAPAYAYIDGQFKLVENKVHTFNEDEGTVLGTVGTRYVPFQNVELFDFLDTLVDSNEAHYETAGALGNGSTVWMLLKPNNAEITIGGDPMEKYLLATTAHDGSAAVVVKPVVMRVVCANTLAYALREGSSEFRARHTASAKGKVEQAREALDLGFAYFADFERDAARLQAVDVELAEFNAIVADLVPIEDGMEGRQLTTRQNARAGIYSAYASPLVGEFHSTGWGVVQAVNTYEQWGQTVRGASRSERQAFNAIGGKAPLTQKARELVLR